MKCFIIVCIDEGALSGYVAAMLWSIVQVERPSSSTSGGQSKGGFAGSVVAAARPVDAAAVAVAGFVDFFIIAIHAELDVQLRQLCNVNSIPQLRWSLRTACPPYPI